MKKTTKKLAVILIIILHSLTGILSVNAQSTTGSYSITVNTPGTFGQVMLQKIENWSDVVELTISGHLNASDMAYFSSLQNMTKLDISQVDINSVTSCKGLKLLQNVILPQSVKIIEDNAFKGCSSLSTINLDQIEEIKANAFSDCANLTGNIKLPNLKSLGKEAFYDCDGISTIDMPIVTEIGDWAFSGCSKLTSIEIPNCTKLNNNCFSFCSNLSTVILSDDLEYIPEKTFYDTGLKSIKLPSKLKSIGEGAFKDCI